MKHIRFETFTATELDKILSGNKPYQLWTKPNVSETISASIIRRIV
jgi:hypothetical protein